MWSISREVKGEEKEAGVWGCHSVEIFPQINTLMPPLVLPVTPDILQEGRDFHHQQALWRTYFDLQRQIF